MASENEDNPLRKLAFERIEEWQKLERYELRLAKWQGIGIGVPGAIVGVMGMVSFFVEEFPVSASWVALVGGILTALAAFLGSNRIAESHFRRHGCFNELVQRMQNAVAGGREPTREELDRFAVEWGRCTLPLEFRDLRG